MRLRLRAVLYLLPRIFTELWPLYLGPSPPYGNLKDTQSSTRIGYAFRDYEVIIFFSYLAIEPCAFPNNFSALNMVCFLVESVTLHHV
jgi:hypothetical protein